MGAGRVLLGVGAASGVGLGAYMLATGKSFEEVMAEIKDVFTPEPPNGNGNGEGYVGEYLGQAPTLADGYSQKYIDWWYDLDSRPLATQQSIVPPGTSPHYMWTLTQTAIIEGSADQVSMARKANSFDVITKGDPRLYLRTLNLEETPVHGSVMVKTTRGLVGIYSARDNKIHRAKSTPMRISVLNRTTNVRLYGLTNPKTGLAIPSTDTDHIILSIPDTVPGQAFETEVPVIIAGVHTAVGFTSNVVSNLTIVYD